MCVCVCLISARMLPHSIVAVRVQNNTSSLSLSFRKSLPPPFPDGKNFHVHDSGTCVSRLRPFALAPAAQCRTQHSMPSFLPPLLPSLQWGDLARAGRIVICHLAQSAVYHTSAVRSFECGHSVYTLNIHCIVVLFVELPCFSHE